MAEVLLYTQWIVNGIIITGSTMQLYTTHPRRWHSVYSQAVLPALPDTAAPAVTMTVQNPLVSPSVSITSVHNDTVCASGDTVQFAAVPVFGGTAPTYLWTEWH